MQPRQTARQRHPDLALSVAAQRDPVLRRADETLAELAQVAGRIALAVLELRAMASGSIVAAPADPLPDLMSVSDIRKRMGKSTKEIYKAI